MLRLSIKFGVVLCFLRFLKINNRGVVEYACECKASEVCEGSMIFIRSPEFNVWAAIK